MSRSNWYYDNNSKYCCDHAPACRCAKCCVEGQRERDARAKLRMLVEKEKVEGVTEASSAEINRLMKICGVLLSIAPKPSGGASSLTLSGHKIKKKKLNWFERHINWTAVIILLGELILCMFMRNAELAYTFGVVTPYIYGGWALWRKNRSWFWILIPWVVFFLKNKRELRQEINGNKQSHSTFLIVAVVVVLLVLIWLVMNWTAIVSYF